MFQKSSAMILFFLISHNSLATAPILKNMLHSQTNHSAQETHEDGSTPDFNGKWVSDKCMGQQDLTLDIYLSYDEISINGEVMNVGAMTTQANSGLKDLSSIRTTGEIRSVEWNNQKTQLMFKTILINKSFDDDMDDDNLTDTAMYLSMIHQTLELNNGQLIFKWNTADYKDLQRIDVSRPTCIFSKVE